MADFVLDQVLNALGTFWVLLFLLWLDIPFLLIPCFIFGGMLIAHTILAIGGTLVLIGSKLIGAAR